ncbi:MAG: HAD family hydrolase [Ardenticatenales bacterium]|nr:HAD family hydrolase [Ardenticatenales bacterium]
MTRPFDLITFDFDGVLLHNTYPEIFLETCRRLGFRWPQEAEARLARFVHNYYASGLADIDIETHGEAQFWVAANRRFLEALEVEEEIDAGLAGLSAEMQYVEAHYFHEATIHQVLGSLRRAGYRLAMLTNRDERVRTLCREWGFLDHFEFIGTRETVGKAKPAPDLFHHISERFNVPAARALHIGDNPYADVQGAHAAGWQCVLIDPDDLFPDWEVPRLRMVQELPGWLESIYLY